MKKLLFASLVAGLLGVLAACSQGNTRPPLLGDCDVCSNPVVPSSGGDSGAADAADGASDDATTSDAQGADGGSDGATVTDAGASE